jgi:hypothetical protein
MSALRIRIKFPEREYDKYLAEPDWIIMGVRTVGLIQFRKKRLS